MLYARGNDKYGPSVLRDVIDIEERYSKTLRKFRLENFSDSGQGYDYKLEEHVKQLKFLIGYDTRHAQHIG